MASYNEVFFFRHFFLDEKVTKKSRQKNASTLKPLRTPAFLSAQRACIAPTLSKIETKKKQKVLYSREDLGEVK
ncbi:MAG: hypothetical protein NTX03_10270 [Bacteroidetes bacterium]|nr:hypothetical protein [Bacteroidota bacterium]